MKALKGIRTIMLNGFHDILSFFSFPLHLYGEIAPTFCEPCAHNSDSSLMLD